MSIGSILFVSLGAVVGLMMILSYLPLDSRILGLVYSPRLIAAHLVAPFDAGVTLLLIGGTILGIHSVTGIGNIVFNIAVGLGLSASSILVRKVLIPRWKKQFAEKKAIYKGTTIKAW